MASDGLRLFRQLKAQRDSLLLAGTRLSSLSLQVRAAASKFRPPRVCSHSFGAVLPNDRHDRHTDTVIGMLVLPPRLSVLALAPPRRLALDPADNHEQYGKECDHRKKVRKVLIGTEK